MPYIALRRLKVGDDLYCEIGDVVPGADKWPHLSSWLGTHVKFIEAAPRATAPTPVPTGGGDEKPRRPRPARTAERPAQPEKAPRPARGKRAHTAQPPATSPPAAHRAPTPSPAAKPGSTGGDDFTPPL